MPITRREHPWLPRLVLEDSRRVCDTDDDDDTENSVNSLSNRFKSSPWIDTPGSASAIDKYFPGSHPDATTDGSTGAAATDVQGAPVVTPSEEPLNIKKRTTSTNDPADIAAAAASTAANGTKKDSANVADLANVTGVESLSRLTDSEWLSAFSARQIEDLGALGEGIGGTVRKSRLNNQIFALKTIAVDPDPQVQRQIMRELEFNRSCSSQFICRHFGAFLDMSTGQIGIAMEYCSGGSLDAISKHIRDRGGRVSERPLGKIAFGVLSGLQYLHERKIIHRDIKPSNILLTHDGQIKLCDFGVSGKLVNSLAGTFTGTSFYMAPERIKGQSYSVTSDVWSMGITILEVAQNRFPFPADGTTFLSPIELLSHIVGMPAPELKDEPEIGLKWTESFRHFLKLCLEKDFSRRLGPAQMLHHPWVKGHAKLNTDMAKWIREVTD